MYKTQIMFNLRLFQFSPRAAYTGRWKKKKKNPEKEMLQIYDGFLFLLMHISKCNKNKAIIWYISNYLEN